MLHEYSTVNWYSSRIVFCSCATLDWASRPTWSPDGRHIAFHRGASSLAQGVYVVSSKGIDERRVPAIDDPWNGKDIFVVDMASGTATNLTNAGTFDWDAVWRR